MDESWRMTMGTTTTNGRATHRRRQSVSNSETGFDPEDFDDVFGGPPRSVLTRKLSADFTSSSEWFYQEVFRESEAWKPEIMEGQRLPEFRIPEQRRSRRKDVKSMMSKSKSTSSSVLSFEEVSPYRSPGMAVVGEEDVALSSFTSRLRPINVPYRWTSTSTSTVPTCKNIKEDLPAFGCNNTVYKNDDSSTRNVYTINNFILGFPHSMPSSESINQEQLIADNYNNFRPYSPSSTFGNDHETDKMIGYAFEENVSYQQRVNSDDHDEDEVMSSSYVIEVNSHTTEANNSEAIDIDEAIAWAKEQFQG